MPLIVPYSQLLRSSESFPYEMPHSGIHWSGQRRRKVRLRLALSFHDLQYQLLKAIVRCFRRISVVFLTYRDM